MSQPISDETTRKIVVKILSNRDIMVETREKSHATVDDVMDALKKAEREIFKANQSENVL